MKHYLVVKLSPRRWAVARFVDSISGVPVYDVEAAEAVTFVNMLDALTVARARERELKAVVVESAAPAAPSA